MTSLYLSQPLTVSLAPMFCWTDHDIIWSDLLIKRWEQGVRSGGENRMKLQKKSQTLQMKLFFRWQIVDRKTHLIEDSRFNLSSISSSTSSSESPGNAYSSDTLGFDCGAEPGTLPHVIARVTDVRPEVRIAVYTRLSSKHILAKVIHRNK